MTVAVRVLFLFESTLIMPLLTTGYPDLQTGEENFFALPALSSLPSESRNAGLNFSLLLEELLMHNKAFGTVSCTLPIEV